MSSPTWPSRSSRGSSQHHRHKSSNWDALVVPRNFARDLAALNRKREEEEARFYEMEMKQIAGMRRQIAAYKRQIEYLLDSYKIACRKEQDKKGTDKAMKDFLSSQGLDSYIGLKGDQNYFKDHMAVASFLENTFLKNMGLDVTKGQDATRAQGNTTAKEEKREAAKQPNLSPSTISFVERMYEREVLPDSGKYKMPRL